MREKRSDREIAAMLAEEGDAVESFEAAHGDEP